MLGRCKPEWNLIVSGYHILEHLLAILALRFKTIAVEYLHHIRLIHEDIGHAAIVDILLYVHFRRRFV